jgi:hypothetical protein
VLCFFQENDDEFWWKISGEYKNPIMDLPRGGIMTRKSNNIKFDY